VEAEGDASKQTDLGVDGFHEGVGSAIDTALEDGLTLVADGLVGMIDVGAAGLQEWTPAVAKPSPTKVGGRRQRGAEQRVSRYCQWASSLRSCLAAPLRTTHVGGDESQSLDS
jgi:hypothetical protein